MTIGESDPAFDASLEFVSKLKACGALPLYKAYLGMLHEGDPRASKMNAAFLTFYDKLTAVSLGKPISLMDKQRTNMVFTAKEMPFVGDSQDWRYWPNNAENQDKVGDESRIYLPSEEIAKLWGQQEDE